MRVEVVVLPFVPVTPTQVKPEKRREKIGLAGYLNTLRSLEMKERNAGGLYDNIRAVYRAEIARPRRQIRHSGHYQAQPALRPRL